MYKRENLNILLEKASYRNADLKNSKVIVRACLNVPLDKKTQEITDCTRIDEALPLIQELAGQSKRIVIMAHLGRPAGKDPSLSFAPVVKMLEERLGEKVYLVENLDDIQSLSGDFEKDKRVFLIENIRFFPGEKSKDQEERKELTDQLTKLGDIFINDAFADYLEPGKTTASTYDIAKVLPSFIGPVFAKEVKAFANFSNPARPFVAVMGGAKLSEKLLALNSLLEFADKVIIGGAMAYTILKAMGKSIGNSLIEKDLVESAQEMYQKFSSKIILPVDHLILDKFEEPSEQNKVTVQDDQNIPDGKTAVDIGPKTIELFKTEIQNTKSVVWNGPMGVFEWEQTCKGTREIGNTIISLSDAYKLTGGGDSISAINKFGLKGFNHISTGGGAMLAFLSYDSFPTLDVILDKYQV